MLVRKQFQICTGTPAFVSVCFFYLIKDKNSTKKLPTQFFLEGKGGGGMLN